MNMKPEKQQILVVEDSPTQATKLRFLLEQHGYDAVVARDAEEALGFLQNTAPALVLSDVMMPGVDGFELCRRIKANDALRDTVVILLTALTNPEDVVNGLTSGADGFLTKPYSEAFLLEKVQSVLTNREIQRARPNDEGIEVFYGGSQYQITAQRHQIVNLLLSTFENVIQKNKELERTNNELTATQRKLSASEERLQQQAADLERANKELESFSYSASHDLRQPLRAIRSFSAMLMEDYWDSIPEDGQEYLERIMASSVRMNTLIDDLLNLSRVTRHELEKVDTNFSEIASAIHQELQSQDPSRKVTVSIQSDMRQSADPNLMRQVLANLLGNAWKYTAATPEAEISFQRTEEADRMIYSVRDNGAGFDSRYIDKLFQPFSRLHSESEFKGTGVGLAIVKRIIERHNGEVWAEGKSGEGAAFFFSLPK
jgi:signal transduction histidine kinase